jgi:type IX secretion system PorP/SprF family membrane protein
MSVSYILQTGENQRLFFGVWGSYYQSSVDLLNLVNVDPTDPLLQNKGMLNGNTFNVGFGIDYNWNDLNVGIAMPNAIKDPNLSQTSTQVHFTFQQEFLFHLSNMFYINDRWQVKGMGVVRKMANEPGSFDLSATGIFEERFWAGMLYRSTGTLSLYVGGSLNGGWVLGYYYDMGLGGVNKYGGGTHEISLSFRFGSPGNRYFQHGNHSDYPVRRYRNKPRYEPQIID